MPDLMEIYSHWQAGDSLRKMAKNLGIDRATLRHYIAAASAADIHPDTPMTPEQWEAWIHDTFPATWGGRLAPAQAVLIPYRERIEAALETNHVTTVWQRLCDDTGLTVSLSVNLPSLLWHLGASPTTP